MCSFLYTFPPLPPLIPIFHFFSPHLFSHSLLSRPPPSHCGFFHGRFFEEALSAVGKKRVRSLRLVKLIARNEASLSSPVHLLPNPSLFSTSPLRIAIEKKVESHLKSEEKRAKERAENPPAKAVKGNEEKKPAQ